jgi:hypothetical protein
MMVERPQRRELGTTLRGFAAAFALRIPQFRATPPRPVVAIRKVTSCNAALACLQILHELLRVSQGVAEPLFATEIEVLLCNHENRLAMDQEKAEGDAH